MIVFGAASGEPTQIFAHQLMQKGSSVTGYSLFNENPADMIEFTKKNSKIDEDLTVLRL